jgi:hypothetical protein
MERKPPLTFLTASPLRIEFDAKSGMVWIALVSTFAYMNPATKAAEEFEQPLVLGLARGTAEHLLADLPRLESMLREATKEPSKPDSVQ